VNDGRVQAVQVLQALRNVDAYMAFEFLGESLVGVVQSLAKNA
jgi:hypothetical protein